MKITRILTFGFMGEIIGGGNVFLLNMNSRMKRVKFDYVISGKECLQRNQAEEGGSRMIFVADWKRQPLQYLLDCWRVLSNSRKTYGITYFTLSSMVHASAIIMAKALGYTVILHAHSSNNVYKTIHRLNRFLLSGKNAFIRFTCSRIAADFMYGRRLSDSSILIHNAIDTNRFRFSEAGRNRIRAELSAAGKHIYGFVGRLMPIKNPVFLVDIFYEIQKRDIDAELFVVGDGELRSGLVQRVQNRGIQEKVRFLGNRSDMNDLYSAMDVLLLPSKHEGLPIVIVEAQVSGLPCVVSEEAVSREVVIQDGLVRFVSIHQNAETWAEEAVGQCGMQVNRAAWGSIAEESDFNIVREASRLENIFLEIEKHGRIKSRGDT